MRVMGVDFGRKRIGISIGESQFEVATARPPIQASGTLAKDAEAICKLATSEEIGKIVLGIPLLEDGVETPVARVIRQLGDHIKGKGFEVAYVDEAFSTVEAHDRLIADQMTAAMRKRTVDGESASVILMRYFQGLNA